MGSEWKPSVEDVLDVTHRIEAPVDGDDFDDAMMQTTKWLHEYIAILDKQSSAEPFGYIATDADTFVKHWHGMTKPFGFLAVYTHPPAQTAGVSDEVVRIAAELEDYKNANLHAADDCIAKDAEIARLQSGLAKHVNRVCDLQDRLAAAYALLSRCFVQIGELTKGLDPHDPIYVELQQLGLDWMQHSEADTAHLSENTHG